MSAAMTPLQFLPVGYVISVLLETPVLLIGLSPIHSFKTKLFAGLWLTACTYPIVVLTLPPITGPFYVPIAETFAPLAECILFATLVRTWRWRDLAVIVAANLASWLLGPLLLRSGLEMFGLA
jgi:hypothetical protein